LRGHFIRSEYVRSFSYTKDVSTAKPVKATARLPGMLAPPVDLKRSAPLPSRAKARAEFTQTVELKRADLLPQTDAAVLRDAARLANRGELREAGTLCENYLRQHPTSAQAYYLLGLVREAEGKHQLVGELFKKAVYLDPDHYEAMIHLALHLVRYGDADSAKKLQQRAHRVLSRKKPE
jgi:chemotaxis protein methyltransferase WspC